MAEKYILDEQGIAHLETDLDTWATWYESHNHIVAETALPLGSNTIHLRTWFLGVDYNHEQEGGSFPLLFETEVKVSSHIPQSILWQLNESNGTRYGTQDAARSGHSILEHNIREAIEQASPPYPASPVKQEDTAITRADFIGAFTRRAPEQGEMSSAELVERLGIGLAELKRATEADEPHLANKAATIACGGLIRCAQYIGNDEVAALVNELVARITDITGIQ